MKVAFIFDTVLLKDNEDYYGMTLTYDFFKNRYLTMFDEMIVSTRVKEKSSATGDVTGYKITNGQNIQVIPVYNYKEIPDSVLKIKQITKELTNVINLVDKVIIRMPSILGIFACDICNKLNKDYMIEMVACAWDGYINHTNPIGKIIAPFIYYKTKKCVEIAPRVLYVTNEFLQRRYPTRGEQLACSDVVLNTLDESILKKRIEKINTSIFSNEIKLCTVANVGMKYKGHEYVIKAISKLNNESTVKYKYYLVGNGNQKRLKNIAKKYNVENDIVFLGSLPHDEVFKIIDDIDIYVQPSLQEGLPRALIEAMSRACPCVGSDVGGIPELLEDKFVFKKKKYEQLYKILNSVNGEELIKNAQTVFENVKNYDKCVLDEKRKIFYTK